jgi:hypothetical protein
MKTLLLLSILVGGNVEVVIVPTTSEADCAWTVQEMLKAMEFPVVDPAAPRVVGAECSDKAPDDAAMLPPPELRL